MKASVGTPPPSVPRPLTCRIARAQMSRPVVATLVTALLSKNQASLLWAHCSRP